MRAKRVLLLFLVLSLVLLGCSLPFGSKATPTPTAVPPTNTALPAATPAATVAATNTPKPADSVAPTATKASIAEPTATKASIAGPTATTAAVEVKPTTDAGQGGMVKKGGTTPEDTVFEFLSHTAWVSDSGDISIVGEVKNVSDQTIDTMVSVEATLMGEDGETVPGDFGAYLDRPVIPPGEKSSFWVLIMADQLGDVDAKTIADYDLTLWVSEEPSPDVEISVDQADIYNESDALFVRGTATNSTDLEFSSLSVYSTLYDASGNVINATVDIVDLDTPLAPGEQADFEGYFIDHFEDADSFYVFVTGWTADQTGASQQPATDELRSGDDVFSIDSHTGWVDDAGNLTIVGYVTNISSETIDTLVVVEAKLTDDSGTAIEGEFSAYLDRPVIEPGGWSSFWVWVSVDDLGGADPSAITDYELLLWVTPEPSPDVELTVDSSSGSMESDAYYVEGTVTNQTADMEFVALAVYSSLYDADGNLVNATVDIVELDTPLAPGEQAQFSGYFPDHFDTADTYAVIVTGYTAEAAGS